MKELIYLTFYLLNSASGEVQKNTTFVSIDSERRISGVTVRASRLVEEKTTIKTKINLSDIVIYYEEERREGESDEELIKRLLKQGVQILVSVSEKSK